MKYIFIFCITLISGVALAGDGIHQFSLGDNPHSNGGCASKKDKAAQFHKFENKDLKKSDGTVKKEDTRTTIKKASQLKNYI